MSIISVITSQAGTVGVLPSIAYIQTTDPVATVTTTGYLNKEVANGVQFSLPCIAVVSTKETPTSVAQVGWYEIQHVGANWSLDAGSNTGLALANGFIFVGNASNLAAPVAMSGDVTISNTGVTAIAANAITTAKILNANVTLAKLAAGITPSAVIKFNSQVTTVGGAAAEAFTVTGAAAATDRAFVQVVDNGTNNVTVLQAVVTNNTLTVTFSADPGNDCVINYQLIRAAS